MTILSKKKPSTPKDRRTDASSGPEVDVHGVVQNEHGASGSIALPNSPYQVRNSHFFPHHLKKSSFFILRLHEERLISNGRFNIFFINYFVKN